MRSSVHINCEFQGIFELKSPQHKKAIARNVATTFRWRSTRGTYFASELMDDWLQIISRKGIAMRTALTMAMLVVIAGCNEPVEATKATGRPVGTPNGSTTVPLADSHRASDPSAPLDQPKNPADEEVSANIRKKMLDTKMAPNLQNLRVTTQDGVVKLRGTVKSEEEKQKVEEIARATDGAKSVNSEIEVE